MKTITIALLALAGFAATSARADSRVNVGVGITFGNVHPVYSAPAPVYGAPVYHVPAYGPARGHWETVTVKTWVPERWVITRDRWGRSHRVLERGYFTYRTDRVWVDHRRDGRGHHDRGGRYGHNDRDGRYGHDDRNDRRGPWGR